MKMMKDARTATGLTQGAMADALGLSSTHLSRVESGAVEAPFWAPLVARAILKDPEAARAIVCGPLRAQNKAAGVQRPPRWFLVLVALMRHDQEGVVAGLLATLKEAPALEEAEA